MTMTMTMSLFSRLLFLAIMRYLYVESTYHARRIFLIDNLLFGSLQSFSSDVRGLSLRRRRAPRG